MSLADDACATVDRAVPSRIISPESGTTTHNAEIKTMVNRVKRNYFIWAVLSPPVVGLTYWLLAFSVVTVGCLPSFADTDFFGVPVILFLLAALSLAALVLVLFAGLHAFRALRARVQRRQRDRVERQVGTILIILLTIAVFVVTAWLSLGFLFTPCR